MTNFSGICKTCGDRMFFQFVVEHDRHPADVVKRCIDTDDFSDMYIPDYSALYCSCSCNNPALTDSDMQILQDNIIADAIVLEKNN